MVSECIVLPKNNKIYAFRQPHVFDFEQKVVLEEEGEMNASAITSCGLHFLGLSNMFIYSPSKGD